MSGHPAVELRPASLVAAAWRAWGEDTPERLRGVFAAAVTDGHALWTWRDQLGYRALFFRTDAAGTLVASEAKQVIAGADIPREPDLEVLERILFTDYDDETPTALKGAIRLPKASMLRATDGSVAHRRYWRPESLLETAGSPTPSCRSGSTSCSRPRSSARSRATTWCPSRVGSIPPRSPRTRRRCRANGSATRWPRCRRCSPISPRSTSPATSR